MSNCRSAMAALGLLMPLIAATARGGEPACDPGCGHRDQVATAERMAVWEAILQDPGWSEREREGARFVARHLRPELFMGLRPAIQGRVLDRAAARARGEAVVSLCWAPDTDPAVLEAFHAVAGAGAPDGEAPQLALQVERHWSRTATDGFGQDAQGLPVTLTWSIVPDGTELPSGSAGVGEPASDSNLRAWLQGLYGGSATAPADQQPWFALFEEVFETIAAQCGLRYVYEPNDDGAAVSGSSSGRGVLGTRGDIRISGHYIDGASNTLAYNFYPDHGDMIIDTGDNYFNTKSDNSRRLFNVMQHEHGHGLGLGHVCPTNETKLMEPIISTDYRGLRFDDIYSLQRNYGDFYERHGGLRNNDTFANATVLDTGAPLTTGWLSIDDNGDTDIYRIELAAGARVTARVAPSSESYLEAAQNSNGTCPAGTLFNSSAIHDLRLELIGPDQVTVVAAATGNPAGQAEQITAATVGTGGAHYLRVAGGSANQAQLYRLELSVVAPAVAVELVSQELDAESFGGANGAPDPGETLRWRATLRNSGSQPAANLTAVLGGSAAMTGFTTTLGWGSLAAGASVAGDFVFALDGDCGDTIKLNLTVTANGGYAAVFPVEFVLGTETTTFAEAFDAVAGLPAGWSSSLSGAGSGWSAVTSRSSSPPRSAFAANPAAAGQSVLQSPQQMLGNDPGTLSFRHYHDTETSWDGGVLEISIGGGAWQDILAAGGSFISGGYTGSLGDSSSNPLSGRQAWFGNSNGFVTCEVALPAAAANHGVRFRWILGHDASVGDVGWYLDDVSLSSLGCDTSGPAVVLEVLDDTASEFDPADTARIRLSSELPPARVFPLVLNNAGTAEIDIDVVGLDNLLIPVASTAAEFVISAVADGLVEGTETLDLSPAVGTGRGVITIADAPYGQWASVLHPLGLGDPQADFDGDGSPNIEEYALGTDPALAASRPSVALVPVAGGFKLPVPLGSLPADVRIRCETSTDLSNWSETGVQVLADGYVIPSGQPGRFLRLVYELLQEAP